VGRSTLGRVLDTNALDACAGPQARLRIDVPSTWLDEGAALVVTAPARLACARCDGGGCDGCAKSGALRAPAEPERRVIRATLGGARTDSRRPITLRIAHPFGVEHGIAQLLLEVRGASATSDCVARLDPATPAPARRRLAWPMVALAVAAAAMALFALLRR
jgi:hypothetical protein